MSQAKPSWASLLQKPPSSSSSAAAAAASASASEPPVANAHSDVQSPARPTPNKTPSRVAMISGHMDLSAEEFARGYHAPLDDAIARGDSFVLGDAKGVDEQALTYMLARDASAARRVTVYASRPANVARLERLGVQVVLVSELRQPSATSSSSRGRKGGRGAGRQIHLQRDAMMTEASDYDILWVRTEAEARALYGDKYRPRVSATELNRQRRAEMLARQGGGSSV